VNLDKPGQAALLKLGELDLEIAHLKHEISKAIDSTELTELTNELTNSSGSLLEARTALENVQSEIKKCEEDIRLVTERLDRDRTRLNNTSSPKDAIGIQAEIDSLLKRRDDLENLELGLLQDLEEVEKVHNQIVDSRKSTQERLDSLRQLFSSVSMTQKLRTQSKC